MEEQAGRGSVNELLSGYFTLNHGVFRSNGAGSYFLPELLFFEG